MFGIGIYEVALLVLFVAFPVVSMWKLFEKAGESGWQALIPFYNLYLLLTLCKRSAWYLVLFFLPLISVVGWLVLCMGVAKAYGKNEGFAIGLFLLPWVFFPIVGFGNATYQPRQALT